MTTTDKNPVLILWAATGRGIRSVSMTLAGILSQEPHHLPVRSVDLLESLAGRSLVQQVAAMVDERLGAAALAQLGWPVVSEALGGRQPRVVVAMDPTSAAAVDTWRGKGHLRGPLVGVHSGLRLEPGWAATAVDRLALADEVQANQALERGLPPECLVPCGVPVCGGFSTPAPDEKAEHRRRFGLAPERPVVLVVTDGLDPTQLTGVLFQLSMVADRATLLFDVARDEEAADLLRRRAALYGVTARMFGKVEEAGELWAASDLVVARPHRYVEQRAVVQRLPLVGLLPHDKEELETAEEYARRGVGRAVTNLATLAAEVDLQLAAPALDSARQTLGEISRRNAAGEVARLVAQVGADAEAVLAESQRRAEQEQRRREEAAAEQEPPDADKRGPLEVIGPPAAAPGGAVPPGAPAAAPQESLADIEAAEAEAGRQVLEHQQQLERWQRRQQLAQDRGDTELERRAGAQVDKHQAAMHHALAELARVAERRRDAEKPEVRRTRLEQTFRKMEVDDALDDLKRKFGL